jgi:alpha-galactosidase
LTALLTLGAGAAAAARPRAEPRLINVNTAGSSLTLFVAGDRRLYQLGYGRPRQAAAGPARTPAREDEFHPAAGNGFILEPAVQAVHADGNLDRPPLREPRDRRG